MTSLSRGRSALLGLLAALGPIAASAAEPSGCAAFKWPIDRERAALSAAGPAQLASGAALAALPATAIALKLQPAADAALPIPPERPSAPNRFAGFLRIEQITKPGTYTIALSAGGWVDVIQQGRTLRPIAFSGTTDCDGLRKLVRYDLTAGDLLLQISGVPDDSITLAVLADP